jgi:DNA-binding CsgD family transcriptional regulator
MVVPSSGNLDSRLVELIYAAVRDMSQWRVFMTSLVEATHATGSSMAVRFGDDWTFDFSRVGGNWTEQDITEWETRFAAEDPWNALAIHTHEGDVKADYEYCPRELAEASVAFRDFYAPRNAIHGMGGVFLGSPVGFAAVILTRGVEGGPFGETEKAVVRALLPHLKQAALLHHEIGSLRSQLGTFTGHLNRYPHPFGLAGRDLRILYLNARARELGAAQDGISTAGGRLAAADLEVQRKLEQLAAEFGKRGAREIARLSIPRPSGKPPYSMLLMPAADSGGVQFGAGFPAIGFVVVDRESALLPDPAILQNLYALTPAEARVTQKLLTGRSIEEIAKDAGISVETGRTHLKRILSKTGTTRQGELIAHILLSRPSF